MAVQLGSAYGKVSIDSSGVASGVNQAKTSLGQLSTALGNISKDLGMVGGAMSIAITAPLLLLAKQAVDFGGTMQEVQYRSQYRLWKHVRCGRKMVTGLSHVLWYQQAGGTRCREQIWEFILSHGHWAE